MNPQSHNASNRFQQWRQACEQRHGKVSSRQPHPANQTSVRAHNCSQGRPRSGSIALRAPWYYGVFVALMISVFLLGATRNPANAAVGTFAKFDDIDGESHAAGYDESTGQLTIARHLEGSSPEWKYVNVRRYASYFDGRFLTVADLNNDQRDDIIIPAYSANRLLILWGDQLDQPNPVPELLDVGAGPNAVAAANIAGDTTIELLIATTGSPQMEVRGWNFVTKEPITGATRYPIGFAQEGLLGMHTAGLSAGAPNPVLGILQLASGSNGEPTIQLFNQNPSPVYGVQNTIQSFLLPRSVSHLTSGHPLGGSQPGWFLAWSPGQTTVVMVPTSGAAPESYDLGIAVSQAQLRHGTHSNGAQFLFGDGSVRFYSFTPGSGFALQQQIDPPTDEEFFALAGDADEVITLSRSRVQPYSSFNFQVRLDSGSGFQLANEGLWPLPPPPLDGQTTVALYTSDPFGNAPLLVESFAAGNWASSAQINGNLIEATIETDAGSASGLENPTPQNLQPSTAPGVGAGTLGNQWERSSSVFYVGNPVVNGLATVGIQPPPGNHPNSIAISFQPGPDVTVHYRINQNAWQTGTGPVWIAADSTVEYFGEHSGGSLSSIHSATYLIDQPEDTDGDDDNIPDTIEALAGGDPSKADTDGDGASDFAELLDGSDLNDPNSVPSADVRTFDEILAEFLWDDPTSTALPAANQFLFVSDPLHPEQAELKAQQSLGPVRFSNITLKRGITSQQAWFPADYSLEGSGKPTQTGPAMTALVGVSFPPAPMIPVDMNAPDPVAAWRQAAQQALDDFHATPLEFQVGPTAAFGAVMIEYWYGLQLVSLGSISSLDQRPRIADTPRSPNFGSMSAADVDALQNPASSAVAGHEVTHVLQQINATLQTEPAYQPMRDVAEAIYAQAIQARQANNPLDPPINALRILAGGNPAPAGYSSPETPATIVALRDQLLNLIIPRPQVELTGMFVPKPGGSELFVNSDSYDLLFANGTGWHPSGWKMIPPGATVDVRGFQLPGPFPPGYIGAIQVLEVNVLAVPEAGYADLDGNGLPDTWEQIFLGGLGSPLDGDTDGDGYLDPEELGAGSDPFNPLIIPSDPPASPRDLRIEFTPGVGPELVWEGSQSVSYDVWVTTGFMEWIPNPAAALPTGPERHASTIDGNQPREFYRVQVKFPWMRP